MRNPCLRQKLMVLNVHALEMHMCVSVGGCRVVVIDARTDCRERRHGFIESRTELLALNVHAPQYGSTLGKYDATTHSTTHMI